MTRRFFAPEVVQASAMDCGPASLKCLLEGFGLSASYGRLREACQTDVDGTSIDTMEDIAIQLGLHAEQIVIPVDHVLLDEAQALPAIVVVRLPNGLTHFVVAWRRHGSFVQIMDPAAGRRWTTARRFLDEIYPHGIAVPAAGWRKYAGSDDFLKPLARRLGTLGVINSDPLLESAVADPAWRSLAALDASARMAESLIRAGGLRRGPEASRILSQCFENARSGADSVPAEYWCVQESSPGDLRFTGAVLVRVKGLARALETGEPAATLPPDLVAALQEPPARPSRELLRLVRAGGLLAPSTLIFAMLLAAGGVLMEALLFRGIFDLPRRLLLRGERAGAIAAVLLFLVALLLIEFPLASGLLRMGRSLEARLRMAFLHKIPRLGDRYFKSRLTSDMTERSHSIHLVRHLPGLGGQLLRAVFELLLTTAAITWLDPASTPFALLSATVCLLLPLVFQPPLVERDLRVRTHLGALSRFYLDALLGLVPIRAHGAEKAVRTEHESLLLEWARSAFGLQRFAVAIDAVQFLSGFGLAALMLLSYLARTSETGSVLLLVYWALNLPVLGQEIALVAWQYPSYRNLSLRLLEPLGAKSENEPADAHAPAAGPRRAAAVALESVSVRASGHTILDDIDLHIAPGAHVAIVGPSGAGKSSLVGLLLGWHRAAQGVVRVDNEELDESRLQALRSEIAWVDPAVQLWNRSLAENLVYGGPSAALSLAGMAIDAAGLAEILEKLPDGLQTRLGEGGALVSGGEGQRVRLARALIRRGARLVILDEPFRGLDRERRRELLARARRLWKDATLICITHDVAETRAFPRVLVIEEGKLVEDGSPSQLASRQGSRYRAMLDADHRVRTGFWSDPSWRHVRLENGVLQESRRRGATWVAG